jgi:DNA-binding beta-propeller fold protein YncE
MRWIALCLALLFAAPARADIVYVLNSGEASISILDARTREEIRRIPILREVHHLVLSPDRSVLLIGDSGGNEMLFLEPQTGEILRRERLSNPYHLEFSPDGRHLVVASLRRDQIDIYAWDAATRSLTLLERLRQPDKPSHIAFSPDSRIAYVTLQGTGSVVAIDMETRRPLWTAPVGPEPAGILWHQTQDGPRLLIGIMGRDHLAVLNPETRTVDRTIAFGRGAHTVFASPSGTLYATSRVDSRIAALEPGTLRILQVWDVPGGPDCLTFDDQGRIWVGLRWAGRVGILDPETGRVETIRVGRSPHGILFQRRG